MKKNVIVILSSFSLFLIFSCKVSNGSNLAYTDTETLKVEAEKREQQLSWTKELESSRLSEEIEFAENKISANIEKNPSVISILNINSPVFPEFEDFGSLDASLLNQDVYSKIEQFCLAVNENIYNGPEVFFDSQYLFNYVFFREELKEGWQDFFKKDFPHLIDFNQKEDEKKSDENQEKDEKDKDAKKIIQKEKLFTKWILGKPFTNEEITEIPIRFYCKYGTVDVTLYLNTKKSNSIYLVRIDKWKSVASAVNR